MELVYFVFLEFPKEGKYGYEIVVLLNGFLYQFVRIKWSKCHTVLILYIGTHLIYFKHACWLLDIFTVNPTHTLYGNNNDIDE